MTSPLRSYDIGIESGGDGSPSEHGSQRAAERAERAERLAANPWSIELNLDYADLITVPNPGNTVLAACEASLHLLHGPGLLLEAAATRDLYGGRVPAVVFGIVPDNVIVDPAQPAPGRARRSAGRASSGGAASGRGSRSSP